MQCSLSSEYVVISAKVGLVRYTFCFHSVFSSSNAGIFVDVRLFRISHSNRALKGKNGEVRFSHVASLYSL